ncbi:MAG: putative sulfate exporter family transporter [Flavobacteriaceae bacterium]|nr:MAG: putative sulfate exporter family transporter [Flavobacteriaceae bacterium]
MRHFLIRVLFFGAVLAAFFGLFNGAMALLFGIIFSFFYKVPLKKHLHKTIQFLLKIAVVGLGFGMNLMETISTTTTNFGLIFFSVLGSVCLGLFLSKRMKIEKKLGYLLTSGTTICGGSAIATVSPVIKADTKVISIALGIVFLLNAVALLVFPAMGHWLGLSQYDFGRWCAIAIHDTSSVVGATLSYGEESLKIATTVKLSRTLWIIPLSLFSMFVFKTKVNSIRLPYFILLFIGAIFISDFEIFTIEITDFIVLVSKRILVLTLFLVGASISVEDIKKTGTKPFVMAVVLWVFIAAFSLGYIMFFG